LGERADTQFVGLRPRLLLATTTLVIVITIPAGVAGVVLTSSLWTNVAWSTAGLAAALALWRAVERTARADRPGWRLLAIASTTWLVGQLLWNAWSLGLPVHRLADASWLAFAMLSAMGLARVGSIESRGRELLAETVPVIAATGTLITALLYQDLLGSTLQQIDCWIALAYPVTYAVVPVMTVQLLLADSIRIQRRPDLLLIAGGIAAQALAFTLWAPRLLAQTYQVGHPLDLLWMFGLVLIAVGALIHGPRMTVLESGGERRFATLLPGALFVGLLGGTLVSTILRWPLGQQLILEAGAFGVGALIGARLVALSRRQRELLDSERRSRNALERAADELQHVALHDPLTKLPNRTLFIDRATQALAAARRSGTFTAALFLDVNDFKRVNDVFGHSAGDALLQAVALRLAGVVRPSDTVARFGGDEFTVLCPGIVNERHAIRVARRIIDALDEPFTIGSRELHTAASVGIAFSAAGTGDAESLVRDADTAMYRAKERRAGGYEVFDEAVRERVVNRVRTEDALRQALDNEELRLAYQPFFCLHDHSVLGFEALLRWDSPLLGELPPSEFIPIAEHSGLMPAIGAWVLDEACRTIAELRAERPELDLEIAVNLSARQLLDPDLPRIVRRVLREHELPASALALEITESDVIEDAAGVLTTLAALRKIGVRLMLDDFGTGFSSLSYLKRFPVDVLKIDRSFVAGLGRDGGDRAIVAAIMGVADALELEVIAEGVESAEQADELVSLGCSIAQGFHYAAPTFTPRAALSGALTA
jgi:diguanylate cyclase (GGDEF)-like protein